MMGFKSRMIPSFEVFRADGNHCRGYVPKTSEMAEPMVAPVVEKTVRTTSRYLWKA
jgi:hypothetical protein